MKKRPTGYTEIEARNAVRSLLGYLGEDVDRDGLCDTPARVVRAWEEMTVGYLQDPATILERDFDAGRYDQMIACTFIDFHSTCVVGSTFVETPRGRIPISRLAHGDWIYTVDPVSFELSLVRCEHPRVTQKDAKLVRVVTDNDTVICTPDHRFLRTDGSWCEAQHLKNNDRLVSLYKGFQAGPVGKAYPTIIAATSKWERGLLLNGKVEWMMEHRFTAKNFERMMVTHHIDECVWNNTPENLEVVTTGEHNRRHRRTQKLANNVNRKKAAATASGREETRRKRAVSLKNYWNNLSSIERQGRGRAMSLGIKAKRNHVVFGVEPLSYVEDVWCMDVPGTKVFFANGMAVHNCEHHMLPFIGFAHIAYVPSKKAPRVVGLSKMARLVDCFARRLQIQEKMTVEIADAMTKHLKPQGVAVVVQARHQCMSCRGVMKQKAVMVTSEMTGCFRKEGPTRSEFFRLVELAAKSNG